VTTLVLTVIGDDRPGDVDELAAVIDEHGGNWEASSMARLASTFAGIVQVEIPDGDPARLTAALRDLDARGALHIGVTEAAALPSGGHDEADDEVTFGLNLVGQDRPGIIHEIAHALAGAGVSIDELTTWTTSAPLSGETLFEASAILAAPDDLDRAALTTALEAVADELMVDLDLGVDPT
jgi:glycine cleavage system regulatory protein